MSGGLAVRFLSLYDGCKQSRTPAQCRDLVIKTMPRMVRGYLVAYDTCLKSRVLNEERCREIFAPSPEGTSPIKLLAIGLLIGYVIGKVL